MLIDRIPAYWTAALFAVQRHCPKAFLGGGALRDLDNGVAVKDLDIFLEEGADLAAIRATLAPRWSRLSNLISTDYGPCGFGVDAIMELEDDGDFLPLNLIVVNEGTCSFDRQAARFDFGICQIAYDGRQVAATAAYDEDKAAKTFTLFAREGDRIERSMRRWDRLSPKYPGWVLRT